MDVDKDDDLPPQTSHESLGELVDRYLDRLIKHATDIAGRHKERTSTQAYHDALLTLGIEDLLGEPPRTVQKRLIEIVREPERSPEHIALVGRLLDELNQEFEAIDIPRHEALKALAKARDENREVPKSYHERRRKSLGEIEGFSL
jgi:hypothetical protein